MKYICWLTVILALVACKRHNKCDEQPKPEPANAKVEVIPVYEVYAYRASSGQRDSLIQMPLDSVNVNQPVTLTVRSGFKNVYLYTGGLEIKDPNTVTINPNVLSFMFGTRLGVGYKAWNDGAGKNDTLTGFTILPGSVYGLGSQAGRFLGVDEQMNTRTVTIQYTEGNRFDPPLCKEAVYLEGIFMNCADTCAIYCDQTRNIRKGVLWGGRRDLGYVQYGNKYEGWLRFRGDSLLAEIRTYNNGKIQKLKLKRQ